MITFYAAVGIFETGTEAGARRPVLLRAGRKYDVTLPEFVLWSSLLWNIYHYDEIKAVYAAGAGGLGSHIPALHVDGGADPLRGAGGDGRIHGPFLDWYEETIRPLPKRKKQESA